MTGLVAGGMLKLILFVAAMISPQIVTNQTYVILTFIGDVPFYFMPLFVAYGTSQKLGCSPVYPMLVACALIHPNFIEMVGEGTSISLFGLPVLGVKYSSTMIPALLSTVSVYYLEKFYNKWVPGILKNIAVGVLTVLSAGVITFVVLAPLGMYAGNYVVAFMIGLQTTIGPLALGILAAILPYMVMTGTHTILAPFLVESLNVTGFDTFFRPALILHVIAEGGAAIGVALRTKKKELRSEAWGIGLGSIFAGISEPAIYGIALRYKKPLYGVMAGGLAGGIIAGLFGVKAYTMSKTTVLALPIFKETMVGMFIACVVALLLSAFISFILGIDETEGSEVKEDIDKENLSENTLTSIVDGEMYPIEEVKDDVFSKKLLGPGVAFSTNSDEIYSPCDGVLTTVFPTGHAYGITREDGVELMIHIGINTVSLEGNGFNVKVTQGQKIKRGNLLVKLDLDYLKSTKIDLSTILVFLNQNNKEIELASYGKTIARQTIIGNIN